MWWRSPPGFCIASPSRKMARLWPGEKEQGVFLLVWAELTNVTAIAISNRKNLALKADGTLVTWNVADPLQSEICADFNLWPQSRALSPLAPTRGALPITHQSHGRPESALGILHSIDHPRRRVSAKSVNCSAETSCSRWSCSEDFLGPWLGNQSLMPPPTLQLRKTG